ncbi:MAG: FmdB family zinc ribbon protein [Caldilineaceae bacterium]
MPIYEFVCRDCGSEFEQLMSFSAHGHPPCPACASQHVSRKIGRPAIHFKGSGWYVTDSKGSKQSANGDVESRAAEKAESVETGDKQGGEKKDGAKKDGEKATDKAAEKAEAKSADAKPTTGGTSAGESKPSAPKAESSPAT